MLQRISTWAVAALVAGAMACGGSQGESAVAPTPSPDPTPDTADVRPAPQQAQPIEAKGNPANDLIPRAVLFGNPDKAGPQISPDGKQLSWLAPVDGVLNVWVAPVGDMSKARAVTADKTRPVRSYFWAYTNNHILYMQDTGGDEDFHIFAVDLTSNQVKDLTPKKKIRARVEAVSHKDPNHVIVGINDRNPQLHDLYKVDIRDGKMELVETNPGFVGYTIDVNYNVSLAAKMNPDGSLELLRRSGKKPKKVKRPKATPDVAEAPVDPMAFWETLATIPPEDMLTTNPLGFDASGRTLYMFDSRGRNTSALTQMDIKTGKSKVIATHEKADASGVHMHPTKRVPQAVAFTYARQEWKVLDRSLSKDFAKLEKISGGEPNVVDSTLDGNTWVLAYLEDAGPVRYYLYDRKKKQETFLFTNRAELEKMTLAKMHPVVIESRDDKELVSYLSLPVASDPDGDGKPSAAQPMVLLVHGGPWARDSWGFNALHQQLSNRGYAVLSVNYRGSTGFGKDFTNAANMEWSGKMHDDLIDAVDWAVAQGVAQKDKICIAGGSYGGYATLVGLTFTPDVFACGVDIVGPSSIVTLLEAIPEYWKPMQDVFKTRVGDWTTPEGKAKLLEQSPLTHVDKIKKPLLIGQGANDPRVKKAESDQIVAAMKAKNIPVTYVLFPDEGHGFARTPNSQAFFAAMEAFLSSHLGGKYQPVTAEEVKGTTIQVPAGAHGVPGLTGLVKELNAK